MASTSVYSQSKIEFETILEASKKFRDNGEFDKSITTLQSGLAKARQSKQGVYISQFLLQIGIVDWYANDLDESYRCFESILEIDTTSEASGDAAHNMALLIRRLNKLENPYLFFEQAIRIFLRNRALKKMGNSLIELGTFEREDGKLINALKHFIEAANIFEKQKDQSNLARALDGIGSVQELQFNYIEAKTYYLRALEIFKRIGQKEYQANMFNNLGTVYRGISELDSSVICFQKSIELKNELGLTNQLGATHHNLAATYYNQSQLSKAKKNYKLALRIERKQDSTACAFAFNELAQIAINEKSYSLAHSYLDSSDIFNSKNNDQALLRNLEVKAQMFEKMGDYKSAYKATKLHSKLYEAMQSKFQIRTIQGLQEGYNANQKRVLIASLQNESSKLSQENLSKKKTIQTQSGQITVRNRWIWIISIATLFLVLAILVLYQSMKIQQIRKSNALREQMSKKVGEDLHEVILSNINGVRMMVESNKSMNRIQNQKIANHLSDINDQVRLVAHRLSPISKKLKQQQFTQLIENDLDELSASGSIKLSWSKIPEKLNELNGSQMEHLYAIIRETLNNLYKHSHANTAQIELRFMNKNVVFQIFDDGIGITKKSNEGMGIQNLSDRTKALSGKVQMADLNPGTKFHLSFPHKIKL